jgi:cytochrome c oxidase subunit 1
MGGMIAEWALGAMVAVISGVGLTNIYLHDSQFPFSPLRFAVLATAVFGSFAALCFCWPKISRRPLSRGLLAVHFWGTLVFFNVSAIPLLMMGMGLQQPNPLDPRVLALGHGPLGSWAIFGLCGLGFYQLPFLWAVMLSLLSVSRRSALASDAEASASDLRTR